MQGSPHRCRSTELAELAALGAASAAQSHLSHGPDTQGTCSAKDTSMLEVHLPRKEVHTGLSLTSGVLLYNQLLAAPPRYLQRVLQEASSNVGDAGPRTPREILFRMFRHVVTFSALMSRFDRPSNLGKKHLSTALALPSVALPRERATASPSCLAGAARALICAGL